MNSLALARKNFHGHLGDDLIVQSDRIGEGNPIRYVVIQEREVSYRFFLHQHPYVQSLTQRLLRKGTAGLQAADTEYQTRAQLHAEIPVLDSKDARFNLPAGEMVYLADGLSLLNADNDTVRLRLAGNKLLAPDSDALVTLAAHEIVRVSQGTALRRISGSVVTLDGDARVTLPDGGPLPTLFAEIFSDTQYAPTDLVQTPYPVKDLDFTASGAYALYNWEVFFHVPFTIATHLSKNQRFAEAQQWFHYLFDPTDDSAGPTPERFWKVRPFQQTDVKKIEEVLVNLATGADEELRNDTLRSIEAWKDAPFRPHVIARYRQSAYMYKTVMAYLDNLIAWGDSLFRQDTGEAIDEAMQLYVLAANILGPRPLPVPKKGKVRPQTYANLRHDLNEFGTVMVDLEADIPFDLTPLPGDAQPADNQRLATLRSLGKALYFCVPRNDKLRGYWDTVADRLFKIRNSLNFQGVFRQLALFEPPIDPALLARATAAGLDVGAIVNGLNQPLPLVRFQLLAQKASEIVQEVKSLGNNLLAAMEKEDGEAMAILRAKHERIVMQMVEQVKYGQWQEAIKSKEGLLQSLALAIQRYTYYERQLGKKADEIAQAIPELEELDQEGLLKMKLKAEEPELGLREIEVDISNELESSDGKIVSSYERQEIKNLQDARDSNEDAGWKEKAAAALAAIPEFALDFHYWGIGTHLVKGGSALSRGVSLWASFDRSKAEEQTYKAGNASRIGSYSRREQDWAFQSNLAAGEISQLYKQLRAAQIREAIAELELRNHRTQMEQSAEVERFLNEEGTEKNGKQTNKALYTWMKREVKGLYAQSFQFAFDIARKAERALQHELGNTELSYLQFGYLAGKEGLLAGEKLHLDLKRMEMAYLELNQREYELTKHISLLQVDPLALVSLRTNGSCTVRLPESLFDMDGPGHYFRRIKTVAVSIPCISGPYVSINCTLTLLKSSIRKSSALGDEGYPRANGAEDDRFSDHFGSLQSIVTSSGQNDSGLFETNLRDERYLPFEYSGVISEWKLELPNELRQFDYNTIADVILHMRYTAREGGQALRKGATDQLDEQIKAAQAASQARLFSVRHEFPTEWAKFKAASGKRKELKLVFRKEHYPFWSREATLKTERVEFRQLRGQTISAVEVFSSSDITNNDKLTPDPTGNVTGYLTENALDDLFIALIWKKS